MIDYKFKAEVLNSPVGFVSLQKEVSKAFFLRDYPQASVKSNFSFEAACEFSNIMMEESPREWIEAQKINHAEYERKNRLKNKITEMLLTGECLFITFTFNNITLLTTKPSSRRKFVQRYLASYSNNYVANIDFGKEKGREHYHAVIQTNFIDPNAWKYGHLDVERVHKINSEEKLANYIAKLTNHAVKETTKRNVMIYGRVKK